MSAAERVYSYVKSRILDHSFKGGEFLTEGEIGEELGISRTPVREALLWLEAEDFVKLLPRKGAFIPEVSLREIREVMEARLLIESFAAEKIMEKGAEITPELRSLLNEQQELAEQESTEEFIQLDRQFHHIVVSNSGNDLLLRFYEGLRDKQIRMGIRAVAYSPERIKRVLEEHEAIVTAVEESNTEELKRFIYEHLSATRVVLEEKAYE